MKHHEAVQRLIDFWVRCFLLNTVCILAWLRNVGGGIVKRWSANLKPVCFITLLFCLIFLSLLSPRLKVPISCLLKAQPNSYKHAMAIFWDGPISLVTRRRHRALLSSKIWQIQSRNKIQFSSVHILIDIALIDSPLLTQSTQLIPWFHHCPRWAEPRDDLVQLFVSESRHKMSTEPFHRDIQRRFFGVLCSGLCSKGYAANHF